MPEQEEVKIVWVQDQFTGAWNPLDSFTPEEMGALRVEGHEEVEL